jgi:hypothetical protein
LALSSLSQAPSNSGGESASAGESHRDFGARRARAEAIRSEIEAHSPQSGLRDQFLTRLAR